MKPAFNQNQKAINKKGEVGAYDILNYSIIRFPVILAVAVVILLFYNAAVSVDIDPVNITNMAHVNRIVYSPSAISYTDPVTERTYPGIVDVSRFNEAVLKSAFDYDDISVVFRLELKNLKTNTTTEAYLNREWYNRWEPLAAAGFEDYLKMSETRFVLIKPAAPGSPLQKGLLTVSEVRKLE